MAINKLYIKRCKLLPTATVLCTHNFACTNVHEEPFYVYKNQCTQILNLPSPVPGAFVDSRVLKIAVRSGGESEILLGVKFFTEQWEPEEE